MKGRGTKFSLPALTIWFLESGGTLKDWCEGEEGYSRSPLCLYIAAQWLQLAIAGWGWGGVDGGTHGISPGHKSQPRWWLLWSLWTARSWLGEASELSMVVKSSCVFGLSWWGPDPPPAALPPASPRPHLPATEPVRAGHEAGCVRLHNSGTRCRRGRFPEIDAKKLLESKLWVSF